MAYKCMPAYERWNCSVVKQNFYKTALFDVSITIHIARFISLALQLTFSSSKPMERSPISFAVAVNLKRDLF